MAGGLGPKRKGNAYERELVKDAAARGVTAERTWGSNGETRGLPKEVDVIFFGSQYHWDGPIYLQAKRPKKIPAYLKVPPGRALSIKCKRSEAEFVALNFQDFLSLFKRSPSTLKLMS
jgi:Holliday junction resolvase